MAFTGANLLMNHPTARRLIENDPTILQIARVWPFLGVDGDSVTYARRNGALTAAAVVNDGSPAPDNSDAVETVSFGFNNIITAYKINAADLDRYGNEADADEYALALRRCLYKYFGDLDNPTTGLPAFIRESDVGAVTLTLDLLDAAYHLVTSNDGRPTVIMASTRGLLSYGKLCRAAGYDTPTIPHQWYDPALGQMVSGVAPAFNGTPILVNDQMASAGGSDPGDQRIYFLVLGDDGKAGPTRGVTGIVPQAMKNTMFVKRSTMGDWAGEAGTEPDTRVTTWVSWPAGFAVGAEAAGCVITNFESP